MTVALAEPGVIVLSGDCPSGDAELLLRLLINETDPIVDWRACEYAHTAVVQVLVAARPTLKGTPKQSFLASMVEPGLKRG